MADLPAPIRGFIDALAEGTLPPAWLLVSDEGKLVEAGGGLEAYGIPGLQKNVRVGDHIAFLAEVLPLDQGTVLLPSVQTTDGVFADVHLFRADRGTWVLLLDRTVAVETRRGAQQRTYDSTLQAANLHEQRLTALNRQLRAMASRIITLQEDEASRVAREIHDELGQLLTAIKMDLRWLAKRLTHIDDPATRAVFSGKLTDTTQLVDATIESVRKISRRLRPPMLDSLGLAGAIAAEAAMFEERVGVPCHMATMGDDSLLPQQVSITVFRIFQEILTNVARHAEAGRVMVRLEVGPERLTLVATDDGRGISPSERDNTHSLGVLGMKERARLLGGEVTICGNPGAGTAVTVQIPLAGHQAGAA